MLRLVTGRGYLLEDALCRGIKSAAASGRDQVIVVPRQRTLQTEQTLLARLKLSGSFQLRVLSPERFCGRIFAEAGQPLGKRIDDRGRTLLAREAVRLAGEKLCLYKNAHERTGFSQRAARQLERLRQASLTPQQLDLCAQSSDGRLSMKLKDLSLLLQEYEQLLCGRFQDGETEFFAAIERVNKAPFIAESDIWFYGFDITPPPLTRLIAAVGSACPNACMLFPMNDHPEEDDAEVFSPLRKAARRLLAAAQAENTPVEQVCLEDINPACPELRHLERQLFAQPCTPWQAQPQQVHIVSLKNPREEARYAAATVRQLCRTHNMRYSDIALLCQDTETYSLYLKEAFEDAGVPLFLPTSRAASRHALAEYLLSALRLIAHNFRNEDVLAYLGTQYTALTCDEANRFANYAVRYGLRGKAFTLPLQRGLPEETAVMEPIRQKLVQPLLLLKEQLRASGSLTEQLQTVFGFLEQTDAYARTLQLQNDLTKAGDRQLANELSQVWNRLLGALDQMAALLSEKKAALKELQLLLAEALDAAVIKPLPQAGDTVFVQTIDRMLDRPVRAALVLGLTDKTVAEEDGLLSEEQKRRLSESTGAYLGPNADELSNLRRFYLKANIGMTREQLYFTYPLSAADNSALRPSAAIGLLRQVFPALTPLGGMEEDPSILSALVSAPGLTLKRLAGELSNGGNGQMLTASLAALDNVNASLARIRKALDRADSAQSMHPATAQRLYGDMRRISVTRLEKFAECPFSFFAQYGLKPDRVEPYALRPADEGEFLHNAIRDFMQQCSGDIRNLSPEQANSIMDTVADNLLQAMQEGPLGDTAVTLAQARRLKNTARTAAEAIAKQMQGSAFYPSAIEMSFGPGDTVQLQLPGTDCVLEGRIDRVDTRDDGGFLRIIDYKKGGRKLNLWEVYCGLRLQLMVYLAVAMKNKGAGSAGTYYFTLDEGILTTQCTDAAQIIKDREKKFRLSGLLPDDLLLLKDMSPDYKNVFAANFSEDGQPYKGTVLAGQDDFRRLTNRALEMAKKHLTDIRRGCSSPSPTETDGRKPCDYCDWRAACMFDTELEPGNLRKTHAIAPGDVLTLLAAEETP